VELVARIPDVWADLFDFGAVTVLAVGANRCRVDVTGAHPDCPARDAMMAGVFARLLTIAGARAVDVFPTTGMERGATIYRASWQSP
jgi:metal-sulfur cluster biosynthetic enzyme